MSENVHTISDLYQMQAMPMRIKVRMTESRIRAWVNEYGEDGVYVSFSGGKDSTVLLDIVRQNYPSIPAVFVDTGLEYPEIRDFVKTFDNVIWIKPKMNFKQVIQKYGYPVISKEVSQKVQAARNKPSGAYAGRFKENNEHDKQYGSRHSVTKYAYLLNAPFKVSASCCNVMKKAPVKAYEKETDKKPITAIMAAESQVRTNAWIRHGCNIFDTNRPVSNPMSFWTEHDVLEYIKINNLPICSVYGEIIETEKQTKTYEDIDVFDYANRPILKTTGCDRTGCMFCGFGCHLEKSGEGRFVKMKETHPKQYDYIMRSWEDGGLNYKEVIDWLNEHGNLNIEY